MVGTGSGTTAVSNTVRAPPTEASSQRLLQPVSGESVRRFGTEHDSWCHLRPRTAPPASSQLASAYFTETKRKNDTDLESNLSSFPCCSTCQFATFLFKKTDQNGKSQMTNAASCVFTLCGCRPRVLFL